MGEFSYTPGFKVMDGLRLDVLLGFGLDWVEIGTCIGLYLELGLEIGKKVA